MLPIMPNTSLVEELFELFLVGILVWALPRCSGSGGHHAVTLGLFLLFPRLRGVRLVLGFGVLVLSGVAECRVAPGVLISDLE
jgi:hypothetical protein